MDRKQQSSVKQNKSELRKGMGRPKPPADSEPGLEDLLFDVNPHEKQSSSDEDS